jgi:hypothetical protein
MDAIEELRTRVREFIELNESEPRMRAVMLELWEVEISSLRELSQRPRQRLNRVDPDPKDS